MHQSQVIATYNENVEKIDDKQSKKMIEEAKEFNIKLTDKAYQWDLSEDEKKIIESAVMMGVDSIRYKRLKNI